jgi:hypothetical protein
VPAGGSAGGRRTARRGYFAVATAPTAALTPLSRISTAVVSTKRHAQPLHLPVSAGVAKVEPRWHAQMPAQHCPLALSATCALAIMAPMACACILFQALSHLLQWLLFPHATPSLLQTAAGSAHGSGQTTIASLKTPVLIGKGMQSKEPVLTSAVLGIAKALEYTETSRLIPHQHQRQHPSLPSLPFRHRLLLHYQHRRLLPCLHRHLLPNLVPRRVPYKLAVAAPQPINARPTRVCRWDRQTRTARLAAVDRHGGRATR